MAVNSAIVAGGYEVVFGAGDAEVLALSAARKDIRSRVPYPAHSSLLRCFDKKELAAAAQEVGLSTPGAVEAGELDAAQSPVVVKSRLHWLPNMGGPVTRLEAMVAATGRDAMRRADEIESVGGQPFFQEFVSGGLLAYSLVVGEDAQVLAEVQQKADYIWPPDSGVSVRAVTVPVDRRIADRIIALLSELGWHGLAQLQFVSPPVGEPKLIDLNGRFYGSLALAVEAGVNLPAVWAAVATGRPAARAGPAKLGVCYQWLEGDLRRARVERRNGLMRDVADSLAYGRHATHSIWRSDDPWPAVRHSARLAARVLVKLSR
jgi:predicted ATP-grasp superfamily ATP-dependent carboligase